MRRSQRSRFLRKLPPPSSRCSSLPCLLPQLVCFKATVSSPVFPCSPLLVRGVTAGVFVLAPSSADTLRDDVVEDVVEEIAEASVKSCLPTTPSLEPAGRLASSSTSGLVCCSTTSSTTARTSARAEASSVRNSWLLPVLARLSWELLLSSTSSSSSPSSLRFSASSLVTWKTSITPCCW